MAFRGIYPAAELRPTEFGILSAARVMNHTSRAYDEKWIRGFSFEYDTRPTVRLLEDGGSSAHTMFDGSGLARYIEIKPFFIEVEDFRSTFSLTGEDRFARVLRQIEAVTQKAIERELENGFIARADDTTNQYLADIASLEYASATPGTAVSSAEAISMLENGLSNSPVGEQGVLHITRDVATLLGSNWLLMRVEDDKGKFHIETINGTTSSIGAGYLGNGPAIVVQSYSVSGNEVTITTATNHYISVGESVTVGSSASTINGTFTAKAGTTGTTLKYDKTTGNIGSTSITGYVQMQGSTTVKWIYATGSLDVHLGKPEVVNDNLAQGYDVSGNQNDMLIKALRPVAMHFDPAMHYAVKVDLTA